MRYIALSSLREALFGNAGEARRRASLAMAHSPGRDVEYGAAPALAYAKADARAWALTDDLAKRFPEDTIVQFNYIPTLRAGIALNRGNPAEAIERLRAVAPYELDESTISPNLWTGLYPVFVRGEAYLAMRQGSEASAEFQKIVDHSGIVVNQPIGAVAHLGLARAYALEGDTTRANKAYRISSRFGRTPTPTSPY